MPFVPAICTQCGSKLRVDSSKEAAICPYCRTPFVTETAINNYNTNYTTNVEHLHADVVNLNDDKSIGSRVRSGETFIKLNDYAAAERIFKELTVDCPYDYRGWWGLIRVYSAEFLYVGINRTKLQEVDELYKNAYAVASAEEQSKIKQQYDNYRNRIAESMDSRIQSGKTFIAQNDYSKAEKIFIEFTNDWPDDYRGWWGLIKVYSKDFSNVDIRGKELQEIEELYKNVCAVASTDEQNKIRLQYNRYHDYVQTSLDTKLKSVRDKMEYCKSTFEQKKSAIEAEIKDCEQKTKTFDSIDNVLIILCCIVAVVAAVVYAIIEGFWLGIASGFIFLFIAMGIGALISIPNGNARQKVAAQIKSLNDQLSTNEKAYTKEMAQLNKFMKEVR